MQFVGRLHHRRKMTATQPHGRGTALNRDLGPVGAFWLAGVLVLLVSAVMLLGSALPAEAHDTCSHHPRGLGVACLKANHSRLDVCDRHKGSRVWARVRYSRGYSISFYDPNGAKRGCGHYNPYIWGVHVSYNVCVQNQGCGLPRYRPGWGGRVW